MGATRSLDGARTRVLHLERVASFANSSTRPGPALPNRPGFPAGTCNTPCPPSAGSVDVRIRLIG